MFYVYIIKLYIFTAILIIDQSRRFKMTIFPDVTRLNFCICDIIIQKIFWYKINLDEPFLRRGHGGRSTKAATKRGKIAAGTSAIDDRSRVFASPLCGFRIFESHLQNKNIILNIWETRKTKFDKLRRKEQIKREEEHTKP